MRFRQLPLILALLLLAWALWASPTLVEIAAGVAIFLFGMMALEQGFKAFTGGMLEAILKRSTDRLWKSLAFGALATTLTQSSSLVSIITISFLSAGLIGLGQGIGVIFGANLGTTTGAWLMAGFGIRVNISAYAMPLLVFGVILSFNRSRSIKGLGYILAGIGFLFLGIHYMKEGFEAYQEAIDLSQFAVGGVRGLLLYTLLGIIATVVMQSSHATLILTITALSVGQITYENALALSIGANVGTTVTALIGAIGANISGRRLAAAHLVFNVSTGLIALVFIQAFLAVVDALSAGLGIAADNHTLKLALFHSLFNLTGIIVMVPLIGRLVVLLEARMQPRRISLDRPKFINKAMLETPGAALEAARRELLRLLRRAFKMIAQMLNLPPLAMPKDMLRSELPLPPERIAVVDLEDLYLRRIKPLHGLILDFLASLSVRATRAQQLVMLRVACQDLIEAVKDAKHLQKNMVRYLASSNLYLRDEYLGLRRNLGYLLHRLDRLAAEAAEGSDQIALELTDLATDIENFDLVSSGRMDELIRTRHISPEQATSLMNDNAYSYRIAKNLLATARCIYLPFSQRDPELQEIVELDPEEVREILSSDPAPGSDSDPR